MSGPIRKDFSEFSPISPSPGSPLYPSCGQHLFNEAEKFYSWYVSSWYMSDGNSASAEMVSKSEVTKKTLSVIKRVAEVSMKEGKFLSEVEEQKVINELNAVFQDLNSGQLRKHDLPEALLKVLHHMMEHNPKAKLVCQTTELEYRLCINPPINQSEQLTQQYQKALERIIFGITPNLHDINASAISQGLSQILENHNGNHTIIEALEEAVKHWM